MSLSANLTFTLTRNNMKHKRGYVRSSLQDAQAKGLTYAEASEIYGITRATVYALCKRYSIKLKRTKWGYYSKPKVTSEGPSSAETA
jgi:transposase